MRRSGSTPTRARSTGIWIGGWTTRFRLDPALVAKAALTDRQVEALEFYDGRNFGYRCVARELDISFESARGLVRAGLRKIEKATRP